MAVSAASAPLFFVASATVATLLTPGYSSVRDTFSLLAGPGAPHPWVIAAGFAGYGLLVQPLGPLLHWLVGRGPRGAVLWALVAVYGAGGVLAAVFRDGHEGPVLWGVAEDLAHGAVARMGFAAIITLTLVVPAMVRSRAGWARWRRFSLLMGGLSLALVVPFQADAWPEGLGVLQRGFFATTLAWVLVTSLRLRRERAPNG
jgi:hypothetical membrane protein